MVLIIIGIAAGGSKNQPAKVNESSNTSATEVSNSNSNNTQPTQAVEFKIGDIVKLGDREFVVNSSKRSKSIIYSTAKSGKEYVIVNVTIQNKGSDEVSFNTFDFKMQDANGAQFSADASSYSLEDSLNSGTLAPNGKITGSLAFEVPSGDNVKLIFQPSFWSKDRVVVNM